jgi:hypothetical protein
MTKPRFDDKSTEFGLWLRNQKEIDSGLGYITSNLDYIWRNYNTGDWMLIEEKRYLSNIKLWQKQLFDRIDRLCRSDSHYKGFHKIVFEKTNPDDGFILLDDKRITKVELLNFLKFA